MTNIICGVLDWIYGILDAILPDLSIDSGIMGNVSDSMSIILSLIAQANCIFPVNTALTILGLVVAINLVKFGIWGINWIVKRITELIP